MEGAAVDPDLSIHFPGFQEARSCRDWEPGVHIDLARIREVDEAYWERYKGAPKAFVAPSDAAEMWRNPYGPLTSLWTDASGAALWREGLAQRLEPAALGVQRLEVAHAARAQARPTTDFGGLFMGLGGLLVISALVLSVLLARLGLAQRAGEAQSMRALGFTRQEIRALRLREGVVLALIASVMGTLGALVFAQATLSALGEGWQGAIGGLHLVYAPELTSLGLGFFLTLVAALGALYYAEKRPADRPALAGGRRALVLSIASLACALVLLATVGAERPALAYFSAGGLSLIAGLSALRAALSWGQRSAGIGRSLLSLGWLNLSRRPRASVAASALLAAGTFIVVGVGVSRHDATKMTSRESGTGGFAMVATTTLPVAHALDSEEGLGAFGLAADDLSGASIVPLRVRDGDDASCLNLAEAPRPALYGVDPAAFERRGAFGEEVWSALRPGEVQSEAGLPVLPALGDVATLTWRLKLRVGDLIEDLDERGQPYLIRIAGILPTSILQGGLIVDGHALAERFPTTSSDRLFLIDAEPDVSAAVAATLGDALGDTGFVATPAIDVLGRYLRVENTYLAIFLSLGGFGLLLGAPGVGVLLFRQVLTRRRELALLHAMGWRRGDIRRLIGFEHGAIVTLGVGIGALAAGLALVPSLGSSVTRDPLSAALLLIAGVLVFGLVGVIGATHIALRGSLKDALSADP